MPSATRPMTIIPPFVRSPVGAFTVTSRRRGVASRDTLHDRPDGGMLGAKPEEAPMAKIKHIALATQDPDATAKFYVDVFGLKQVGRIDNPNTSGYYLSDGDINLAILKFKND